LAKSGIILPPYVFYKTTLPTGIVLAYQVGQNSTFLYTFSDAISTHLPMGIDSHITVSKQFFILA
jgi:hypothetical protein